MYKCILGSAIILSYMTIGITDEIKPAEQQLYLMSPIAIQDYARSITENVSRTVESILALSPDEHTFENTLLVWNQLFNQLKRDKQYLKTLAESSSITAAADALADLTAFLNEVDQDYVFLNAMADSAERFQEDSALSPFQQHMAARYLDEDDLEVLMLYGTTSEWLDTAPELTVLNLGSAHQSNKTAQDLAKEILEENADVVCISDTCVEQASALYDSLSKSYSNFIYVNRLPTFSLSEEDAFDGLLIVSKYRIDSVDITQMYAGGTANEGCVDFVIKSGGTELGHIYAVNLSNHADFDLGWAYLNQIVYKVLEDAKDEEKQIPFLMSGDVSVLQQSSAADSLDHYFQNVSQPTKGIPSLALKCKPLLSIDVDMIPGTITKANSRQGLKAAVRSSSPISSSFDGNTTNNSPYGKFLILGGQADVSVSRDTDGNTSVDVSVSTSRDTDHGNYEVEVKGTVNQDRDGNRSGTVEFGTTYRW